MSQQQQTSSWNNFFHRDQANDTTNNNENVPMGEPARLSYFPYKQEGDYGDVEKTTSNPEDPSFWKMPGSEQANVMPSAPPPESLHGSNPGREGSESDEEYARRLYREDEENYMRYSQQPGSSIRGSYPGEAAAYYEGPQPQGPGPQGPQGPQVMYDPNLPKAYMDPNVQRQLQKRRYWIPYFTYLVTLIQAVLLIYEFIYNRQETGSFIQTQPFNIFIGPNTFPTLTRLGARFVPCMRPIAAIPPTTVIACVKPDGSQGQCTLEDICGFGFSGGEPNQWFRFITPIFLHAGVLHFVFNMLFQLVTARHVESDMGFLRFGIIYMGSGIFGFIFGGNFANVTLPSLGASGSLFGIVGVLLLDLLQNWKLVINPCWELTKLLLMIIISFLLGLLPAIDNFSHIGGFIMGVLLGLVLMPTISFSIFHKRFNWLLRFIALPIAILLFFLLIRNFYTDNPTETCPWCKYLDCLPISNWCDVSGLQNITSPTTTGTTSP